MLVSIVSIGNSKGIRIPKTVLDQLNISDKIDMEIIKDQIILKPVIEKPRVGWDAAFKTMHNNHDDILLIPETSEKDGFQWDW